MSTRFTVVCDECEAVGPHLRRQHDKAYLFAADTARVFPDYDPEAAANDWGAFLVEHEWCSVRLVREHRGDAQDLVAPRETAG